MEFLPERRVNFRGRCAPELISREPPGLAIGQPLNLVKVPATAVSGQIVGVFNCEVSGSKHVSILYMRRQNGNSGGRPDPAATGHTKAGPARWQGPRRRSQHESKGTDKRTGDIPHRNIYPL